MSPQNPVDWKKYVLVLLITVGLFATAGYLSNYFGNKKIDELKSIQDKISVDILSSETQFSLLSSLSCKNVTDSVLASELSDLGARLDWGEKNIGMTEEVAYLKNYYSLLEIKDYLLQKQISERCKTPAAFILYFYTTAANCSDCEKESLVLTALRDKYPDLRVYSFDYSTDLSAVEAMLDIYKIKDTALPAVVIDDDVYTGFHPMEELDAIVSDAFKLEEATPENAPAPADKKSVPAGKTTAS